MPKDFTASDFHPHERAMRDHVAKHDTPEEKFGAWFGDANKRLRGLNTVAEIHAEIDRADEMQGPITKMIFG